MKKKLLVCFLLIVTTIYCFTQENNFREIKLESPEMNGDDVISIQTQLYKLDFLSENDISGFYGQKSEAAIKDFQKYF